MLTSYNINIFKNTSILSANSSAIVDMQINLHFIKGLILKSENSAFQYGPILSVVAVQSVDLQIYLDVV